MKTVYACTHMTKHVEEDVYSEGCVYESGHYTMDEGVSIKASDLAALIKKIGDYYGFTLDDIFIPGEVDESGEVAWIGFNRNENAEGSKPTDREIEGWKRGEVKLWLADYSFAIEKRTVCAVLESEFEAAGIKVH